MSAVELMKNVGKSGLYHVEGGLHVAVNIIDAKSAYGSVRLLIQPVAGEGGKWVESFKVSGIA